MIREINLLAQKKQEASTHRSFEKYKKWIILGLAGYILLVFLIFGVSSILFIQEKSLKSEITKAETTIRGFQKIESLQTALKERTSAINGLLSNKKDFGLVLAKSQSMLTEGATLKTANIDGQRIFLEISVPTIEEVYRCLSTIGQIRKDFNNLLIGPINREQDGGYGLTISGIYLES
jgi:hypothetical protein